jgi:hypothetical protein
LPVTQEHGQCGQAFQAVVQRFGRGRAVRDLLALQHYPLMKCIGQWFGSGLPGLPALIRIQIFDLPLHVIKLADVTQCLLSNLALVTDMQIKELTPRMRQAADLRDSIGEPGLVATKVIANQTTFPLFKEGSTVLTGSGFTDVVDHCFQILNVFLDWASSRQLKNTAVSIVDIVIDQEVEQLLGGILRFLSYKDSNQILQEWAPSVVR